ncbi:hypothetical protein MACH07_22870 [Flagellimonas marinaquae]|uniref:Ig-like domain-containing protein n=1 Tax=Flagellimonas marinaquae TaxID=254955 RepID=A0AA48KPQ2_9FLAO|nr:hypothetical protein MACH07_22870 [Allomuricauda aquimarina]
MKLKLVLTLTIILVTSWAKAQVTPAEKQALQDLYNATNGTDWISENNAFNDDDWNFGGIVTSNWHGVTVANGHVIKLELETNQLVGNIPSSIGSLVHLTDLNLSANQLSGNLPNEMSNFLSIKNLQLHGNNLSGNFPSQIIILPSLETIKVEKNLFDFGNLEDTYQNNNGVAFTYSPQQKTDQPEAVQIIQGENITLTTNISGSNNHYKWHKDGQPINGAPDSPNYEIVNVTLEDAGTYYCVMASEIIIDLALTRHDVQLSVEAVTPGEQPEEEDWNTITVWDYDMATNLKANSRRYYNDLGNHVQTQSWDPITKTIWGQVTLYDFQGRPALSTLSAPILEQFQFQYHPSFITNEQGEDYEAADFETNLFVPNSVHNDSPLGQFYSGATSDKYQDITTHPFSRTIFSNLNPDAPLAMVGGNKVDTNGDQEITPSDQWPQVYRFTMPASDELSLENAFDDANYKNIKTLKTITRDVHGNENVVFVDTDGKLLATARSGKEGKVSPKMDLPIGSQGYVDIHIPQGVEMGLSTNNDNAVSVYDLISDNIEQTPLNSLPPGFYRVAVNDTDNYVPNTIVVSYFVDYYDYSLSEYDEAGRLVASYQPVTDNNGNKLASYHRYNTLGQLVATSSPDEGSAKFKYRGDGQIRYSQNSEQAPDNKVSYTDYDPLGRPVESGVLQFANFNDLDPDAPLPTGPKKEVVTTTYDFLNDTDMEFLASLYPEYQFPSFLAGNVAKTANAQVSTYYSYDVYGRVKWLVQHIEGLGTKTLHYEYEPRTGLVQKVIYQKEQDDQFIHKYAYNLRDQLLKVETSANNVGFELQAQYFYNDAGTLVRTELADGAQGLDYVYNLAGQLKSINHPSLESNSDPGGDANDLFGMQLDYHLGDYQRTENTNIITAPHGKDQYNGNIKGFRWQTGTEDLEESHYTYSYDRNNWLTGADFAPKNPTGKAYDVYGITYDANGNIQTLVRNKDKNNLDNTAMDNLAYNYDPKKPNRLLWVDDSVGNVPDADDLEDQSAPNYKYNSIGQLVYDHSQQITYIYNTSGLVTEVQQNGQPLVKFFYNDRNQRVKKEAYANGNPTYTTFYVRDVAGQVMAVYSNAGGVFTLMEQPVYGAGRIGIAYNGANYTKTYVYELTDHLGNVRAVFTKNNNDANLEGYTDYYPGGMAMPNRNLEDANAYRYGYQGQYAEEDKETGLNAFQLRMYDPRINRWLSPDPYGQYHSPYMSMGNNWISRVDPDGGFDWKKDKNGNIVYDSNLTAENADFMLGEGETYLGETHFEGNIFYHSNGLINNFDTGEFFQAFDHGLSEVVVGPGATVHRSSIQGYDFMLAIETLNANALPKYIKEKCGQCARKVREALNSGGLDTSDRPIYPIDGPNSTYSAKNYSQYLPTKGFSEVSSENYVPMAGDIVVIQSYTGGSVHGHIQMYNGEEWVSDFVQNDFWPGSGYKKNKPSYNIFR